MSPDPAQPFDPQEATVIDGAEAMRIGLETRTYGLLACTDASGERWTLIEPDGGYAARTPRPSRDR